MSDQIPEVVERVARALCSVFGSDPDWTGYQSGPADDARPLWMRREKEARAVIAAMREPTDAMIAAGWPHTADPCWEKDVAHAWRAMIDAALAQHERSQTEG